jgi:hypothetical protein
LFRRSEDNAWLEFVPNIYREAFGWDGADFPDDSASPSAFPTITHKFGKGTARLIHKEADRTVWQSALSAELPEMCVRISSDKPKSSERVYDQRAATPPILQPSDV